MEETLLEHLAERMDCVMLSELRLPELRGELLRVVRETPAGAFPAEQWREALDYLLSPLDTADIW